MGITAERLWTGAGWKNFWSNPNGYKVILLGDLLDPRYSDEAENLQMDSVLCARTAMELNELGWLELVQSNHQANLINWFYGRRKKLNYGLNLTVNALKKEDEFHPGFFANFVCWLESRPYFYSFTTNGQKYICCHGYATPGASQFHPDGSEIDAFIYGLKEGDKDSRDRKQWWLDSSFFIEDVVMLVGHYHLYGMFPNEEDPKVYILDAGCGSDNGKLAAFLSETKQVLLV